MPHPKSTPRPGKVKVPAASKDVVPLGRRDVFKNSGDGQLETFKERPTTAKAMVLRNGKSGAMGTGEVVLLSKIGGREKLDLLAEDYTAKAAKAVATPFRLEQCVKIAESQLNVYLDGINTLNDPELFASKIRDEIRARRSGSEHNPSFVASVIGSTIHNMYMLASAWSLAWMWLGKLAEYGLEDSAVKSRLRRDEAFRSIYLVLYHLVQVIAEAEQKKFAVLATSAEHFARYFKLTEDEAEDPEWVFDWTSLKTMHKSFLDSIVVELCLPNSQYSKQIMLQLLEEATTESRKETKRFPQALWDAVGDLSVTVQMLAIVEAPLLGAEGEALKRLPHGMPDEYETWVDAQLFSAKASQQYANYKDVIFPLERTKTKQTLDTMWRHVNLNYKAVSGLDIDTLWDLKARFKEQTPQFHGYYIPGADEESDKVPGAFPSRSSRQVPLPSAAEDESDDDMPELQSVSHSSSDKDRDSASEWGSEDDHWEEDDWDTEDEEGVNEYFREMMSVGMEHPDFLDPRVPIPEFDKYAEERKDNPFLKLLGSLRGRLFSSNAALKTTGRTAPRRQTTVPAQRSTKVTVEDVEDEGEGRTTAPKKKKKKKPKKKSAAAPADNEGQDVIESVSPAGPEVVATPPQSPVLSTQEQPRSPDSVSSPSKKKKKKRSSLSRPDPEPTTGLNLGGSLNASTTTFTSQLPAYASTTSLPLPESQRAQSARSYVRSEGLTEKAKVKSRPIGPTLEPVKEKKGFWSKFSKKEEKKEEKEEDDDAVPRENWGVRMKEQTKMYIRQMIGTKDGLQPMKWENFLKIMREMGFQIDPSTAGSSVRFDPPNPKDRSITFHKPHPDPTLSPWKVREFGRRLKDRYGWIEDDFIKRAGG